MKIEVRTPAGAGGYTVLADEGDATDLTGPRVTDYQPPAAKFQTQEDNLMESDTASVDNLGNALWRTGFGIERQHATGDAAAAYMVAEAALFKVRTNFDVKVTIGATVWSLSNCAPTEYSPRVNPDKSTYVKFAWAGGSYA